MKIALTLIMELAGFFILLIWNLKGQLAHISKPRPRKKRLKQKRCYKTQLMLQELSKIRPLVLETKMVQNLEWGCRAQVLPNPSKGTVRVISENRPA